MVDLLIAFGIAFGLIFVMELGDKTQIIILCLATKKEYSPKKLAIGAIIGFAVIVTFGGIIAILLSTFIELYWITIASGIVFVILGAIQIAKWFKERGKNAEEELACDEKKAEKFEKTKYSFVAGFLAIVSMELGDKTQVTTILLASTSASLAGTLLGSWCALSLLALIGALAGKWIAKKVPARVMEIISAVIFIIIGTLMLITSFGSI